MEGGAGAQAVTRNPNALYEIDKLSMDHVTVFPDGQLNIDAVASVPGTSAFARPVSAGECGVCMKRGERGQSTVCVCLASSTLTR